MTPGPATAMVPLLEDFSLEMTGKDVARLEEARDAIPPGTRINVTFLQHEDLRMRLDAARAARRFGFVPVPHISARRLRSPSMLAEFLAALQAAGATDNVFVVGGDPATPHGPYEDSLAVIRSGLLLRYGVRHVSVSGYPEGHPAIADLVLWSALEERPRPWRNDGCRAASSRSSASTSTRCSAGSRRCGTGASTCRSGSGCPARRASGG